MIVDAVFFLRLVALVLAGTVAVKNKTYLGTAICFLYICVTTVNYLWANPTLNAIFSTPLVFLTAWFIIRCSKRRI
jgi:hypothetical protein